MEGTLDYRWQKNGMALGGIGAGSVEICQNGELREWDICNMGKWGSPDVRKQKKLYDYDAHVLPFTVRAKLAGKEPVVRRLCHDRDNGEFRSLMYSWYKEIEKIRWNPNFPVCRLQYEDSGLDMQKAELQKNADSKRAEADAAYEIQKEEQRKTIEVTAANANIAKEERLVLLKQREAETMEKSLDAQVKKKAEAEKFERQQKAEAELFERQKEAEAKKFETEKAAEAQRAKAEADLFSKEQEAKGIRMVGEAEAEAIRAKGVAEAEAMEKRAQAYQKYNNAAMAEMLIKVLPDIAGKIAEPLTQIDKITIIGGSDGSNGVDQVAGNVPAVMTKLFETMKETVGIDLAEVVKAGTYDAKVNRNITINADGAKQAAEVLKQETAAEASAEIAE